MSHINKLNKNFENNVNNSVNNAFDTALDEVNRMLNILKDSQTELMQNSDNCNNIINDMISNLKSNETRLELSNKFKTVHQQLTKFSKQVDKNISPNLDVLMKESVVKVEDVNAMIIEQWLREGQVSLAEKLMEHCELKFDEDQQAFLEIRNITEALRQHNVQPCLDWMSKHAKDIHHQAFLDLTLKLHRLQYLQLLQNDAMLAIHYAKKNLVPFYETKPALLQQIGGCLVFGKQLSSSPYNKLLSHEAWLEAENDFINEYCKTMGFAPTSPLHLCLRASKIVIPKLLKYETVMKARQNSKNNNTISGIGVQLDKEFHFHSTFVCPVTKEESTIDNPPMLLECGHCISQKALDSMLTASRSKTVKCPYCPKRQSTKRILKLHI